MAGADIVMFIAVAALLFLLIWFYFLYFNRPKPNSGWSKLPEEHIGILGRSQDVSQISTMYADYIKMGYGIIDEEPLRKQYLMPVEDVQHQLEIPPPVPVHSVEKKEMEWKTPAEGDLRRVMSTESLDSTTSSLMDANEIEIPTVHLVLTYHEPSQMLTVQVEKVTEVCDDLGHIWLLFFLLPHPKPLWRTAARLTPASSVDYNCVYQQCVRKADLSKIALLVQLYCSKQQSASIKGQCRLRLKDVDILNGEAPVSLCLQSPIRNEEENETNLTGEVLFMTRFSRDTLSVVVSKIQNIDPAYKSVFIRLYVVLPMGKSIKKKTSERTLLNGSAEINESMFFNVSKRNISKGALRLSVVCSDGETIKSIGHITLSSKSSGKELGHWTKALSGQQTSTVRWHSLRPRRTRI